MRIQTSLRNNKIRRWKNKSKIESTYEKRRNLQKTEKKQSTNTPQRKNPKIIRCIKEIRHNRTG